METLGSSENCKQTYRSIYSLIKQLEDQKKNITLLTDFLSVDVETDRQSLVEQCVSLMLEDHNGLGKKAREILWRKGFYDYIAIVKKFWRKDNGQLNNVEKNLIQEFLLNGIKIYKQLAIKVEKHFHLRLRFLIDFSILDPNETKNGKITQDVAKQLNGYLSDLSIETVNYALEILHSFLLSLGDLHRYFIEFGYTEPLFRKSDVARFYFEAFKLNPTIGMAQNQLGTLFAGLNFDLDSIYHYFYSLVCTVPFELSENNVGKLLLNHVDYLEKLSPDKIDFNLKDFFARFFLIADIFFFDKDVPEFTNLCHCVLVDLRKVLCAKSVSIQEASLFKIVGILFFCMSKLKMINSQKVYSLNAFLAAACSDLVDSCIVNLEQFILTKTNQNETFQENYMQSFIEFENGVRKSRDGFRQFCEKQKIDEDGGEGRKIVTKQIFNSTTDSGSQRSYPNGNLDIKKSKKDESNRSSDEAKEESDLRTSQTYSLKSKQKKNVKMRRRRRVAKDSEESTDYESDSDLDSDFSSNDEDNCDSDLSTNFDSEFSDEDDENPENILKKEQESDGEAHEIRESSKYPPGNPEKERLVSTDVKTFSDEEDIVIEEERVFYPDSDTGELAENFSHLKITNNALVFKSENEDGEKMLMVKQQMMSQPSTSGSQSNQEIEHQETGGELPSKLKYKNKYTKIDPNIIIQFAQNEPTMRSLKILFDWLNNKDILFGCYHSNPEFLHKIMKLLNYCNIDIFTRKVFFDRTLIKTENVRSDLMSLFELRSSIPLSEDVILKNFDLFKNTQMGLDWEIQIKENITQNEDNLLRIFKIVDFGFYICKMKKLNYKFCAKTRRFIETAKKKRDDQKKDGTRSRRRRNRKRNEGGRTRRTSDRRTGKRKSFTSNEEKDTVEESRAEIPAPPRKGYLRNRNQQNVEKIHTSSGADDESTFKGTKAEIMGQLWLRNEIRTLEHQMRDKPRVILTPFVVVDAKALTDNLGTVKNLVKTKKFVVLIPNSVLSELDELKKSSDRARNVIRWLEHEFTKGNRHLRSQRPQESLSLSLIKIPKRMDRDATFFLQTAQFCNYIVTHHSEGNDTDENIITYLSGDNLKEKRLTNFSYTGILDAIPVRYEQIGTFYGKLKKK